MIAYCCKNYHDSIVVDGDAATKSEHGGGREGPGGGERRADLAVTDPAWRCRSNIYIAVDDDTCHEYIGDGVIVRTRTPVITQSHDEK